MYVCLSGYYVMRLVRNCVSHLILIIDVQRNIRQSKHTGRVLGNTDYNNISRRYTSAVELGTSSPTRPSQEFPRDFPGIIAVESITVSDYSARPQSFRQRKSHVKSFQFSSVRA